MTNQDFDGLFRAARLPVDLSTQRIDAAIDAVMMKLDAAAPLPWWKRAIAWRDAQSNPLPVGRFALAMTVAAVLGFYVGRQMDDATVASSVNDFFSSSSGYLVES